MSHHGSRANVTSELLTAVRADHYIFSTNNTNNAIFKHPDDEARSF
jgi:beta-lactamase superfamily II metal-dependent hydrolase